MSRGVTEMFSQFKFVSLLMLIEEDRQRRAKLTKALRLMEGQIPNVTLESVDDDNDPSGSNAKPAIPDRGNSLLSGAA